MVGWLILLCFMFVLDSFRYLGEFCELRILWFYVIILKVSKIK